MPSRVVNAVIIHHPCGVRKCRSGAIYWGIAMDDPSLLYFSAATPVEVGVSPRILKTDPIILGMPSQKMAVVEARGCPGQVFTEVFPALFSSVYALKFDLKKSGLESFKVSAPRARYPDLHLRPKEEWLIVVGIPVPDSTDSLPQRKPGIEVKLDTWEYGTVAQILHLGPYDEEEGSVERLQSFISGNGYEVVGPHEEEYLSRPDAKTIKTLIRYRVRQTGP